jgi:hypothetical protein
VVASKLDDGWMIDSAFPGPGPMIVQPFALYGIVQVVLRVYEPGKTNMGRPLALAKVLASCRPLVVVPTVFDP